MLVRPLALREPLEITEAFTTSVGRTTSWDSSCAREVRSEAYGSASRDPGAFVSDRSSRGIGIDQEQIAEGRGKHHRRLACVVRAGARWQGVASYGDQISNRDAFARTHE